MTIESPTTIVQGAGEIETKQPQKRVRARKPAKSKLPWLRCRHCKSRLLPVDVVNGMTCVRLSPYAVSYKTEITCEACGWVREFVSHGKI